MFYSAQTGGFYDREIHGDTIPTDAIEITTAEHATLLTGQSAGQRIEADEHGRPVLRDAPALDNDALADAARARRDELLTATEWIVWRHRDEIDAGHEAALSAADYSALLGYRQKLRDLPEQDGFPQIINWPAPPEDWLLGH